jgi:hypothetical protein
MSTIVRKPNMNRVYITGDVDPIRDLLRDLRARHDDTGYWLPLHQEAKLKMALATESEYQVEKERQRQEWETAKAAIPSDYKTRHGATYGGTVVMDGERFDEPGLDTSALPWRHVATHQIRVRDLTDASTINGRVQDSEALYSAITPDGRPIFRIAHSSGFGDDLRETYYLPADLWRKMMEAEIGFRQITPQKASEWLRQYRGCVGTEVYEFAAAQRLPSASSRPSLSDGTEGRIGNSGMTAGIPQELTLANAEAAGKVAYESDAEGK